MDTLHRFFSHVMSHLLIQDLGNSKPSAMNVAVTNLRFRNARGPKKERSQVLPFSNMHNPCIFCLGLLCCSFKKNIIIFGTPFKALLVMRLHQTLLTWVSKTISKANASTDGTLIWNSGQTLIILQAPTGKSATRNIPNISFLVCYRWFVWECVISP